MAFVPGLSAWTALTRPSLPCQHHSTCLLQETRALPLPSALTASWAAGFRPSTTLGQCVHTFGRRARAVTVTPRCSTATPPPSSPPDTPVRDVPFEIRGFSLANVALLAGCAITIVSFSSFFNSSGTASATSLGFVYGVPVLLIGCALKYAELLPIPLQSTPAVRDLRERAATATQKKIISDITRHRYGDEAHLAPTMSALGLVPRGAACPELLRAAEREQDGRYVLALEFFSTETPFKEWQDRVERMERFFGPDITVQVEKLDSEKRLVELRLISTTTNQPS